MTDARHLVVGAGEVGVALAKVLSRAFQVQVKDVEPKAVEGPVDVVHVCLNYHGLGHDRFVGIVNGYLKEFSPRLLDICSTVTPGTTSLFGPAACHSTTRGLHPNLERGLISIAKHVGGPKAKVLARMFAECGVRCVTHARPETTEVAHILNNSAYGVSLMFADEAARLCRHYGVDYYEAVMKYTDTHNEGFRALDHPRLVRSVLTPPNGRIGGHCVVQGAGLIPDEAKGPLLRMLERYNDPPPLKCKHGWQAFHDEPRGADCPTCFAPHPANTYEGVSPEARIGHVDAQSAAEAGQ